MSLADRIIQAKRNSESAGPAPAGPATGGPTATPTNLDPVLDLKAKVHAALLETLGSSL